MVKIINNKWLILTIILTSTLYTLWYMSFGNITKNSGALSTIGLDHKGLFIIWGTLTLLSLILGINKMYGDFKPKYNFNKFLFPIGTIGMILTLFCDFDFDNKIQYFAHCIGSIGFTVIFALSLVIFFINLYKTAIIFKIFTFIIVFVMIVTLVFLLIYKETSLLEVTPMLVSYIIIILVNNTNLFKTKELLNAKR